MKQQLCICIVIGFSAVASPWLTDPIFAACPCNTADAGSGKAEQLNPRFNNENYATGDWFGLRNTLYDYGIEITGGYTTEPAGNPVGGLQHGFTYLHNL